MLNGFTQIERIKVKTIVLCNWAWFGLIFGEIFAACACCYQFRQLNCVTRYFNIWSHWNSLTNFNGIEPLPSPSLTAWCLWHWVISGNRSDTTKPCLATCNDILGFCFNHYWIEIPRKVTALETEPGILFLWCTHIISKRWFSQFLLN